jgi:hypothetical protein
MNIVMHKMLNMLLSNGVKHSFTGQLLILKR